MYVNTLKRKTLGALLFHGLVQGLVRTGAEAYLGKRHDEIAALPGQA